MEIDRIYNEDCLIGMKNIPGSVIYKNNVVVEKDCVYVQAADLNVPLMEILRNLEKVQQPMLGFYGRRDLKIKR